MIELVVILVIVGILAAIAIPRFIQAQANARYQSIAAVLAQAQAAANAVHAKAIVAGQTGSTGQITMDDGTVVAFVYGYPAGNDSGILKVINTSITTNWYTRGDGRKATDFLIINQSYAVNRCYGSYWEPNASNPIPIYKNLADIDPLSSNGAAGAEQCR